MAQLKPTRDTRQTELPMYVKKPYFHRFESLKVELEAESRGRLMEFLIDFYEENKPNAE